VRGIVRRGLRLKLGAGLGIALVLSVVAAHAQGVATTTTLTAGALTGCSQALTVTVTGNGQPVTGTVTIEDNLNGKEVQLASAALSAQGTASPAVSLTDGVHNLTAVYAGNSTDQGSTSSPVPTANVTAQCEFTVAISPATLSLAVGQTGTVSVSVISSPDFTSSLTAPVFVTLSCSSLPDESACTFTPENVEILPNATAPLTSSMVLVTQLQSAASVARPHSKFGGPPSRGTNAVAWAILLPGALGLGGLGWGLRRRPWLSRLSLFALVGLVTMLGTTACNPRYDYEHHGPPINPATPAGTYTISVTAQSSNGITAVTNSTTLALTVQ
jgi:hypothetical protein